MISIAIPQGLLNLAAIPTPSSSPSADFELEVNPARVDTL
jgi:hypothetical protein